jgi:membrane protease YdiL (CAAX protease family)
MPRSDTNPGAELFAASALMSYNVVLNRRLPDPAHVPANLAAAGLALAFARWQGATTADLGLARMNAPRGARIGLAAIVPIVASVAASSGPQPTRAFYDDDRVTGMTPERAAYELLVRIPLGTALAEELIFRSALLGLFRRNHSTVVAVAASSVLFGLWHVAPTLESLRTNDAARRAEGKPARTIASVAAVVAITAGAGAVLAALRLRSRSVLAPILAHAAINQSAFAAARFLAWRAQSK